MSLKDAINKKKQEDQKVGINHHPEIDAKIDKFIAENPELYQKISAYPHEDLVRKRILDMVNANERSAAYREEMRSFVEQNPEVKHEVDRRMKRIPADQRESAFMRTVKNVAANFGMRQSQQSAPGVKLA